MIEDEIEKAKTELDIIDISDSPEFIESIQKAVLSFYKDKEGNHYLNYASAAIAKSKHGNNGSMVFDVMKYEINDSKARKVSKKESLRILKQLQKEKNYRYQYFG